MNALRKDFKEFEGEGEVLFQRTVQAIRDSLEASLKTIFVIGAVAMLISFLLVVTIPEVSMEVKPEDPVGPGFLPRMPSIRRPIAEAAWKEGQGSRESFEWPTGHL